MISFRMKKLWNCETNCNEILCRRLHIPGSILLPCWSVTERLLVGSRPSMYSIEPAGFGNTTNAAFLIPLNLILMLIIGYLTLDSDANLNSRIGALLLSFFIPFFITYKIPRMSGIERMLTFWIGFIVYIILALIKVRYQITIITGLIPCLQISLAILCYGNERINSKE